MAEWVVEETPLVDRAALIEGDEILAAHIALKEEGHLRLGAVVKAHWHSPQRINAGERPAAAILRPEVPPELAADAPNLLPPRSAPVQELYLPRPTAGLGPGSQVTVEIVRESVWTPRSAKLAKVRLTDAAPSPPPALTGQLGSAPVRSMPLYGTDDLEAAGWTELIEEAESGRIDRDGVRLWLDTTEAMTLIDIDGTLPAEDLAVAGAKLAARTILRLDIGGSIGVDFPTVDSKAARAAAAEAFDATMIGAFERTAINGYGFMQIIRPLLRPSIVAVMASRYAHQERTRPVWRAHYNILRERQ